MKRYLLALMLLCFISCNKIENGKTLNQDDIKRITNMKLLDQNETIYKFYSQYKKTDAGNFFTNKRVAAYWIDKRNPERNTIATALYSEISKIQAVYNVGATYCPYAIIFKKDGSTFNVYVDGEKTEIKSFFDDLIFQWKKNK